MSYDPETILQIFARRYADDVLPPNADYAGNEVKTGKDDPVLGRLRKAIGCRKGQPDNQITYRGMITYIEWKQPGGGRIEKEQEERHAKLTACGAQVFILRSVVSLRQVFLGLGISLRFHAMSAEVRDMEVLAEIEKSKRKRRETRAAVAALQQQADAEAGVDELFHQAPIRSFSKAKRRPARASSRLLALAARYQAP